MESSVFLSRQEHTDLVDRIESLTDQLNVCQELLKRATLGKSLDEAEEGDFLVGGEVLIAKYDMGALIAAPQSTESFSQWDPYSSEVFANLEGKGYTPSQWFVPNLSQLLIARRTAPDHFDGGYWSSDTFTAPASEASRAFYCHFPGIPEPADNSVMQCTFDAEFHCHYKVRAFRLISFT